MKKIFRSCFLFSMLSVSSSLLNAVGVNPLYDVLNKVTFKEAIDKGVDAEVIGQLEKIVAKRDELLRRIEGTSTLSSISLEKYLPNLTSKIHTFLVGNFQSTYSYRRFALSLKNDVNKELESLENHFKNSDLVKIKKLALLVTNELIDIGLAISDHIDELTKPGYRRKAIDAGYYAWDFTECHPYIIGASAIGFAIAIAYKLHGLLVPSNNVEPDTSIVRGDCRIDFLTMRTEDCESAKEFVARANWSKLDDDLRSSDDSSSELKNADRVHSVRPYSSKQPIPKRNIFSHFYKRKKENRELKELLDASKAADCVIDDINTDSDMADGEASDPDKEVKTIRRRRTKD